MSPFAIGIICAATCGLCWAILAIGLKYTLGFASSGTIVWVRMVVAFITLFLVYFFRDRPTLKQIFFKPPLLVMLAGLFLSFNYFGYMTGLALTSASNVQIMIQIGPLALLFTGIFYFKEKMRLIQWLGVIVAGIGFIFFYWDQFMLSIGRQDDYITGNIWVFFAALAWALFATFQKVQLSKSWTPQMVNVLVYGTCSLALLPTAKLNELSPLNLNQWLILIALGINTVIAYGAFGEAMKRIPASYVSLIITANPLVTILIMTIMAHIGLNFVNPEPIYWRGYLGALLVVTGVGIAVSLKSKKTKSI